MVLGAFLSILILILSPVGTYRKKITETKDRIQDSEMVPSPNGIIMKSKEIIEESELLKYFQSIINYSGFLKYLKGIIDASEKLQKPKEAIKQYYEGMFSFGKK